MHKTGFKLCLGALAGAVLFSTSADSQSTTFSWAPLIALNKKRTVLLKVESPGQPIDYGSGIVVGPLGYVLTARHILGDSPIDAEVSGLLNWTNPSVDFDRAISFHVVYASKKLDFAVLEAAPQHSMPRGIALNRRYASGDPLMLMGYPSGGNLISTFGFVSGNASGGRFASDVHAGGGNSGGPVIAPDNSLLGLLIERNRRTDDGTIELSYALSSDAIMSDLANSPGANLVIATVKTGTTMSVETHETGIAPPAINIAYGFDDTKDDHPSFTPDRRAYRYVKLAQPGYLIRATNVVVEHRNHVATEPTAEIIDSGRAVIVTYALESGPMFDRWRGWIDGRVETTQQQEGKRQ